MALSLADDSTDDVNHGSAAALDNIAQGTLFLWAKPADVANSARMVVSKQPDGAGNDRWTFFRVGFDGTMCRLQINRAGDDQIVELTGITANVWQCLAATWDITNGGPLAYRGTLTSAMVDVSANAADGGGAKADDSGQDFRIGEAGSFFNAAPWDIAVCMLFDIDLPIAEVQALQFRPYNRANCLIYCHYGFNGIGTQPDWSGNGNNGIVTTATVADHVPIGPAFGFGLDTPGAPTRPRPARYGFTNYQTPGLAP